MALWGTCLVLGNTYLAHGNGRDVGNLVEKRCKQFLFNPPVARIRVGDDVRSL